MLKKCSVAARYVAIFGVLGLVSGCGVEFENPTFNLSGPNYTDDDEAERELDASVSISGGGVIATSDRSELYFYTDLDYSRILKDEEPGTFGITGSIGHSYSTDLADISLDAEISSDAERLRELFDEGSVDVTLALSRTIELGDQGEISPYADYNWSKDFGDEEKSEEVSIGVSVSRDLNSWASLGFGPSISFDPNNTSEISKSLDLGLSVGWDLSESASFSFDMELSHNWDSGERSDEISLSPSTSFEWRF